MMKKVSFISRRKKIYFQTCDDVKNNIKSNWTTYRSANIVKRIISLNLLIQFSNSLKDAIVKLEVITFWRYWVNKHDWKSLFFLSTILFDHEHECMEWEIGDSDIFVYNLFPWLKLFYICHKSPEAINIMLRKADKLQILQL